VIGQGSKYAHLIHAVRKLMPGEVYVGTKGEDFTCEPMSFQGVIYEVAATKGAQWKATTVVIGHHYVAYAFYKETDYMRPHLPACPMVKKLAGER
jgi:hypothetical protein